MSDLKERVGYMTGGNANLIPYKGALVVGDGEQTVYLMPSETDGLVLTLDSETAEGMSWQAAGGGGGSFRLERNFLDNEQYANNGAFEVGASSYADFTDAAGGTLTYRVGGCGFNDAEATIDTNAKLQIYINCASPNSVSGGTLLSEIDLTSAVATHKIEDSATITAPAGSGFINVGVVGGSADSAAFNGIIKCLAVSFKL